MVPAGVTTGAVVVTQLTGAMAQASCPSIEHVARETLRARHIFNACTRERTSSAPYSRWTCHVRYCPLPNRYLTVTMYYVLRYVPYKYHDRYRDRVSPTLTLRTHRPPYASHPPPSPPLAGRPNS